MRPKIAMWSDYGAPRHKHWRAPSRRSSQSSIGPKILLAVVVIVAGVIGISGIYPQIIDSEWVQGTSAGSQRVAHSKTAPTPPRSGIVAEIPLPPRRAVVTTGEAVASPSPPPVRATAAAPAPVMPTAIASALSEVLPSVAAADQPAADPGAALAITGVPDAKAIADLPATPASDAIPTVKPTQRYVGRAPVVKRRVVRSERHRGYSGAYAQYGGGWSGWPSLGSPYHF
jgi:hypothetical protein